MTEKWRKQCHGSLAWSQRGIVILVRKYGGKEKHARTKQLKTMCATATYRSEKDKRGEANIMTVYDSL